MQLRQWQTAIGALLLSWSAPAMRGRVAQAQDVSISGNAWVAYAIIGALILGIVIFVLVSVGVAKRDRGADDSGLVFGEEDPKD